MSATEAKDADKLVYVIEKGSPAEYFVRFDYGAGEWTADFHRALRTTTRAHMQRLWDCDRPIFTIFNDDCRIAEHMICAEPQPECVHETGREDEGLPLGYRVRQCLRSLGRYDRAERVADEAVENSDVMTVCRFIETELRHQSCTQPCPDCGRQTPGPRCGKVVQRITNVDELRIDTETLPACLQVGTQPFRAAHCCPCRITCESVGKCEGLCPVRCRPGSEFQVNREGALYSLEDIRAVLAVHWLTEIQCGHDTKTDRSFCWCGSFICEPQPSVGAAVTRWVEHVMAQLPLHRDACEFVANHQPNEE